MKKFLLVPVWLVTFALLPFLSRENPLKKGHNTLRRWDEAGTREAVVFGALFWVHGVCAAACLLVVFCNQ